MKNTIHQPHDKLFKRVMSDMSVAHDFFKLHLPKKLLDKTDFSTLKMEHSSYIDPNLVSSEADLVYIDSVDGEHEKLFMEKVNEHFSPDLMEDTMSLTQHWREQGRQEGSSGRARRDCSQLAQPGPFSRPCSRGNGLRPQNIGILERF